MNPDLSRRIGRAVGLLPPGVVPLDKYREVGMASLEAETFEDLPEWIRDVVLQGEAITAERAT